MLKKYPEQSSKTVLEVKNGPSLSTLHAILNYSKSTQVKKLKKERLLIHLN
jgi:hypothetical protein